jgi:hypothetical protein
MTVPLPHSYQFKFCASSDPDTLYQSALNASVLKEIVGLKLITIAISKLSGGPTLRYSNKGVLKLSTVTYAVKVFIARFTYALLTHEAEPFLRSRLMCSHSRTSQHFMEPVDLIPCSQEPSTGPFPETYQSNPHHPSQSL